MEKLLLIIVIFILGIYVTSQYSSKSIKHFIREPFMMSNKCPNILVKKGNKIYLKMSGKAEIPGVNPIVFNNLNEYIEFLKWQRSQNMNCPVLYLEHSYNTQGDEVYKMRPDILNPQGGLNSYIPDKGHKKVHGHGVNDFKFNKKRKDFSRSSVGKSLLIDATRNDPPYNKNQYPGFDQQNQYIGLEVPLDKMFHSQERLSKSDNPMDTNWGGAKFSEESVKSGAYKDDNVSIWVD
jgi:hypothetical protein